jgi:putative ABC transport system substrate-binding protein
MRRRNFIALLGGAAITWPLAARAQQGERMRRVASTFRQRLPEGWTERHNIQFDYWFTGESTAGAASKAGFPSLGRIVGVLLIVSSS